MFMGVARNVRAERDLFEEAPWNASLGLGYVGREGDEPVESSGEISLKLGYDVSPRWTFEGDLGIMPKLKHRTFNYEKFAISNDTWGVRMGVDVLLHLRNTRDLHFDPFLAAGVGMNIYGDSLNDGSVVSSFPFGLGVFWHFNDEWALRGDYRLEFNSVDWSKLWSEYHQVFVVGVNYRFGGAVPPTYVVTGGDIDSDGDGLLDSEESDIRTDPYNPDTDDDGLTDGDEVNTYKTDPLNPDSDWDGLKDGAEVLTYSTDPMDSDTDDGGVTDGHEVIEDNTDPLDPADDLQLFTLNIEFDYNKSNIRPEYFEELDVIVKVLQRDKGATARVEGHADKRPKSKSKYNMRLSERRAKAVVAYLIEVGGIEPARLTYEGYGFTRPIAPNDTEENMQKNRRTEIYIRPSEGGEIDTRKKMVIEEDSSSPAVEQMESTIK